MPTFEEITLGARLRGLAPAGVAEVVHVARFGTDALNLVFRVNGSVGERLVYRGEDYGNSSSSRQVAPTHSTPTALCSVWPRRRPVSDWRISSTHTWQ